MSTKEQEHKGSAIRVVASAVLSSPGATEAERELAQRVLGSTEAAIEVKALGGPIEAAAVADTFNRQMDAVLEATNRSRQLERPGRRAHLASALERAGLVLVDRDELARLFAVQLELDLARARIEELEQERTDCVIEAAVGCGLTPIEAVKELKDRLSESLSFLEDFPDDDEAGVGPDFDLPYPDDVHPETVPPVGNPNLND